MQFVNAKSESVERLKCRLHAKLSCAVESIYGESFLFPLPPLLLSFELNNCFATVSYCYSALQWLRLMSL